MKDFRYSDAVLSKSVDLLRFPLAVMVLFIHTNCYDKINQIELVQRNPFSGESIYQFMAIMFSEVLTHIAVPTFFMFSGYFFFYKMTEWNVKVYRSKLKKRALTLLVPYLLWNTVLVVLRFIVCALKGGDLSELVSFYQSEGWYRIFWDIDPGIGAPADMPLWFVRNLMFLCMASPVVYVFVRRLKVSGLVLLAALFLMRVESPFIGIGVSDLFFFTLGAYFSLNKLSFVETFRKVRVPVGILALVVMLIVVWFNARHTETGAALFPFFILFGSCTAINISSFLVERFKIIPNRFLANSSFFIYASHMVYILFCWDAILCRFFPPTSLGNRYIIYFGMPLMCTLTCLLIYYALKRYMPGVLYVLTGNR